MFVERLCEDVAIRLSARDRAHHARLPIRLDRTGRARVAHVHDRQPVSDQARPLGRLHSVDHLLQQRLRLPAAHEHQHHARFHSIQKSILLCVAINFVLISFYLVMKRLPSDHADLDGALVRPVHARLCRRTRRCVQQPRLLQVSALVRLRTRTPRM